MKKKKILVVNYEHYHTPYQMNAFQKYCDDYDVTYYTSINPKRIKNIFIKKDIKLQNKYIFLLIDKILGKLNKARRNVIHYKLGKHFCELVKRKNKNKKYDIIHAYNGFAKELIDSDNKSVKLVECGVHPKFYNDICQQEFEKYSMSCEPLLDDYIKKSCYEFEKADYILTQSPVCVKSFIENGIERKRVLSIPLGVNVEHFKRVCDRNEIFTVLYVGRVTILKGVQYLIEACEKLANSGYKLQCLIVGPITDEYMSGLEKKYKKNDVIKFLGKKDIKDLSYYYSRASVMVMPSLIDSFCMTVFESLACSTPVIITENVGAPIIDGENGFIVPIRSVEAIINKIQFFYNDRDKCNKFGENGMQMVSKLTWDNYAYELKKCYEKMLENKE